MHALKPNDDLMPVLYLPHGCGPLPLLGDAGHQGLIRFLKSVPQYMPQPKAILMISAHWESKVASVSSSAHPQMIYDYHGFPEACYAYQYPAAGDPLLAQQVADCLASHAINCRLDATRGYDHGTFVPLMLMYPQADIPVVQLSLLQSLDPAQHIALGEAIATLREQDVLIIGSGMSFHELDVTFEQSLEFDRWLTDSLVAQPVEVAKERLVNWTLAPASRNCHRREDHLLPLHVCFGAAMGHAKQKSSAQKIYSSTLFDKQVAGFIWR